MKKQQNLVIISILIVILVTIAINNQVTMPKDNSKPPVIIIRIDDVQDFAFKEAQLFLLNYSIKNQIPLTLAIIPEFFGKDLELVEEIKQAIKTCEVVAHGWEHENLTQLTFDEQKVKLLEAKEHLDKLLNTETDVLVPPMFSYNDDTVQAMKETGYRIVSGLSEFHNKGWASAEIMSLPATIELSDYSNETWHMKTRSVILDEVENSIETHGYAMIVTHPQEFMKNGDLDPEITTKFGQIFHKLSERFSFTTIDDATSYLQQDLVHQIYWCK